MSPDIPVCYLLDGRNALLTLLVGVPVGAGVYVVAARLLHIEMLSLLWGARHRGAPGRRDDQTP